MSASSKNRKSFKALEKTPAGEVEVLYQKIGNRWFAFSELENDVVYNSIDEEILLDPVDLESLTLSTEAPKKAS